MKRESLWLGMKSELFAEWRTENNQTRVYWKCLKIKSEISARKTFSSCLLVKTIQNKKRTQVWTNYQQLSTEHLIQDLGKYLVDYFLRNSTMTMRSKSWYSFGDRLGFSHVNRSPIITRFIARIACSDSRILAGDAQSPTVVGEVKFYRIRHSYTTAGVVSRRCKLCTSFLIFLLYPW